MKAEAGEKYRAPQCCGREGGREMREWRQKGYFLGECPMAEAASLPSRDVLCKGRLLPPGSITDGGSFVVKEVQSKGGEPSIESNSFLMDAQYGA